MKHSAMKKLFNRYDARDEGDRTEIYEALTLAHQKVTLRSGEGAIVIDDHYSHYAYFIESFMRFIEKHKRLPYVKDRSGIYKLPTGKWACMHFWIRWIKFWMSHYDINLVYSPHVELFFDVVQSCGYPFEESDRPINMLYTHGLTIADFGNHLVSSIITALDTPAFRTKLAHQRENSFRQFSSSVNYVQYLLQRHSRLLHIRVDLSYDRSQIDKEGDGLDYLLGRFAVFRKLMSRKTAPFDYLDGYIAHLEYGELKGHHIHMSLFYYGQKKIKDRYIADQIRLVWGRVTEGKGLFQSTNLDINPPACNALGMIEREDQEKFNCLVYTIWYLVKSDQYLTYKYHKKQRLFFRGAIIDEK